MILGTPSTIVFDFDYTLADSSQGIALSANHALDRLGLGQALYADICKTIGLSLVAKFRQLRPAAPAEAASEFERLFIEKADEVMVQHTHFLEGVPALVNELRDRGFRLAICSTKYRRRIEDVLVRDGLRDRFAAVVGGEDVTDLKPAPDGLLRILDQTDTRAHTALYVGDSTVDAEAAQRADVPFVAVLSGSTRRAAFEPFPARAVLDQVTELPTLLA